MLPEVTVRWDELLRVDPGQRLNQEKDLFPASHDRIGGHVAEQWKLPHDRIEAIQLPDSFPL